MGKRPKANYIKKDEILDPWETLRKKLGVTIKDTAMRRHDS